MKVCSERKPDFIEARENHEVACYLQGEKNGTNSANN